MVLYPSITTAIECGSSLVVPRGWSPLSCVDKSGAVHTCKLIDYDRSITFHPVADVVIA